jgi:hypothetical protein
LEAVTRACLVPGLDLDMARALLVTGLLLVVMGLALTLFPRALSWFGNLPGDIDIRRGNSRVFAPLTSLLLISVSVSLLLNVAGWLIRFFR